MARKSVQREYLIAGKREERGKSVENNIETGKVQYIGENKTNM